MRLLKSPHLRLGLLLVLAVVSAAGLEAAMPPTPAGGDFLHDYAGVIPAEMQKAIRECQATAFHELGTPIVVVTLPNLRRFSLGSSEIEAYAKTWFNTWGIGSRQKNDGILILLVVEERSARIELGTAWGRRWDGFTTGVMDNEMVPHFKTGDYGGGLLAAVDAMDAMAAMGPEAEPPRVTAPSSGSAFDGIVLSESWRFVTQENPLRERFGSRIVWVLVPAGLLALALAFFLPAHRSWLVPAGLGMIGLALLFWLVAAAVALHVAWLNRHKFKDDDRSGGGFDGGSSGGGGATGKW